MKSKFILLSSALLLSAASFAQQMVTTGGQKYTFITEGTGAWCPYCSDGIAKMADLTDANPKLIAAATHNSTISYGRYDGMEIADGAAWNSNWCRGPLGYPYGTVDCHFFGLTGIPGQDTVTGLNRDAWSAAISTAGSMPVKYDLTMTHSYDKTTKVLTVVLTGKALAALTGSYNFNVWLTEDDVQSSGTGWDQANAYNSTQGHKYYNAGSPIPNFKHEHVVRQMLGGTWGVAAATNPAANSSVSKTFTFTMPAHFTPTSGNTDNTTPNLSKMHLIGFVQTQTTGSKVNSKNMDILNSVEAVLCPWSTNVATVANFSELNVFPNPATDYITVRGNMNTPTETTLTLTNTVGQVIFSQTYPKAGSLFAENISLNAVSNGVYFLNITNDGNTTSQKIVVNK